MTIWFANLMEKNRTTIFAKEERLQRIMIPGASGISRHSCGCRSWMRRWKDSYTDKE